MSNQSAPLTKTVVVIGGGFAGLAAATALAEAGYQVQVIERRPFLGGRAYSMRDAKTGDVIDNGQHLMMGCYRETFAFLRRIGSFDLVEFQTQSRVDFLDRDGHQTLECPNLPAPLHLLAGLFRLGGISFGDKLRTLRIGGALRLRNGALEKKLGHLTVDQWLSACGQSALMKERFWEPLTVATLNEALTVAPAKLLARVLQDGFGGTKQDSCMVTSKVGLSELYTEQSKNFIEAHGGKVLVNTAVSKILIESNRFSGIELATGERITADFCVSAVPYFALKKLLPAEVFESSPFFAGWKDFQSAPILSINVWFDRPVTDLAFAGMIGTRIQWVFNKEVIVKHNPRDLQHLALIISAAHDFAKIPKEQLVELAVEDLRAVLPAARNANVLHSFVVKEHDATLSTSPDVEKARPNPQTPISNFLLAGDWTNTHLPATIEGAVLSGHLCAKLVLGR